MADLQGNELETLRARVAALEQAQAARQAAETRYQTILSAFPDLIFRINRGGVYLEVIGANEKMLLAPRDSYIGKTVYDIMTLDTADQLIQYIRLALDTGFMQTVEYRLPALSEGADREGRIVPCASDEVLLIVRDITERKRLERTLNQYTRRLNISHNLHQGVLAGLPFAEVVEDALVSFCELVPCQVASLAMLDFENRQSLLVISAGSRPGYFSGIEQAALPDGSSAQSLLSGKQYIIGDLALFSERHFVHERWLEQGIHACLSMPITGEKILIGQISLGAEQPDYFSIGHQTIASQFADQLATAMSYAYLREQVQHHNAELQQHVKERTAELERTRSRVEAILNNSSDAIILARADGNISQTNLTFDRMFQYQPDELFNKPLTTIVPPDSAGVFRTALQAVTEEGLVKRFEVTAVRNDRTIFDAEVGLSLIRVTAEGQRGGVVCLLRDITDRKRTEAELIKALKQERELGELKTRFISMASHEFRTPLTTILSSSDLLESYIDKMNADQKGKHFFRIRDAVRHMTQLLDEVLLMGKAEAGQLRFNPTLVDVVQLAQDVLEQVRPTVGSNIKFSTEMKCDTKTIRVDETLIRQMLTNLLSNAIKYSPNGGIIHFELRCGTQNLFIRVQDQGMGIPSQDQERIFEPFHRADNVGTIRGTGLGLAITKRAIDLHGGTITFESQLGVGTTFTVTIPMQPAEEMQT